MNHRDFNKMQFDQLMHFQNNQWEQFKQFSATQTEQFNSQVKTERPKVPQRRNECERNQESSILLEDIIHSLYRNNIQRNYDPQYTSAPTETKQRPDCRRNVVPSSQATRSVPNVSTSQHDPNLFVNNCISSIFQQLQAKPHNNVNNVLNDFLSTILEQNIKSPAPKPVPTTATINKERYGGPRCRAASPPAKPVNTQPLSKPVAKELSVDEKALLALESISSEYENIINSEFNNVKKEHQLTQLLLKIDAIECSEATRPVRKLLVRNINSTIDALTAPVSSAPFEENVSEDNSSEYVNDHYENDCSEEVVVNVEDDVNNEENTFESDSNVEANVNDTAVHNYTKNANTTETGTQDVASTTTSEVLANTTTATLGEPETFSDTTIITYAETLGAPDQDSSENVNDVTTGDNFNYVTAESDIKPDNVENEDQISDNNHFTAEDVEY